MLNPKIYATHAWHNSIVLDVWADQVVHLLLIKQLYDLHNARPFTEKVFGEPKMMEGMNCRSLVFESSALGTNCTTHTALAYLGHDLTVRLTG